MRTQIHDKEDELERLLVKQDPEFKSLGEGNLVKVKEE